MRIVVDGAAEPIEVKLYRLGHCQMGAWILWTLQSFCQLQGPIANMTCSRWYQSWWKWWAKSLQSSDAHLRKAAPTKRTLEFAGGDDVAGMDFRIFQEATSSTYALVHMLVRFSTPSRGSFEKSARVQLIWDRWLGALIVRFFGTTTLDFVIMVDPNCDARLGLPAQCKNPIRVRVTNGNLDLSPIALADIASVSPTSVELRHFGDWCTAMPMGVALREVHRQGRTSLWMYKQVIFNVAFVIEAAVLESSAESKVDDGQVEQEDIAPEEEDQEDAAHPEDMLRPAWRIGRARGRKKFLERVQRSVPPVVTMRLIMTCFCLRQYFSGCQNLSFGIDVSRIGLLNRMLGLICVPDGFDGWLHPQATTSNHIQIYHRGTRRINF